MPNQQIVMMFRDGLNSFGWSEVYYTNDATITAGLATAVTLKDARKAILNSDMMIVAIRVSTEGVRGDSAYSPFNNVAGLLTPSAKGTCDPWTALLVRQEATPLYRGRKFLHGIDLGAFNADGSYNEAWGSDAAMETYEALIGATPFVIKRVDPANRPLGRLYTTATAAVVERKVEHRVGRPFGALRGRRLIH